MSGVSPPRLFLGVLNVIVSECFCFSFLSGKCNSLGPGG